MTEVGFVMPENLQCERLPRRGTGTCYDGGIKEPYRRDIIGNLIGAKIICAQSKMIFVPNKYNFVCAVLAFGGPFYYMTTDNVCRFTSSCSYHM